MQPHRPTMPGAVRRIFRSGKEINTRTQQAIAYHPTFRGRPERTIYKDGRPHPPEYAAHTWQGFLIGKSGGDILTVTTTHP
jgi:hypothetical protein